MSQALVELRQVKKTFHHLGRPLQVLKGIELQLHRGELAAIVGPSGAGKSTLLHCLGTLDLPSSGQILLDGQDVTTLPSARLSALRNKTIGFVFQFHHLLPEFTALENVMMPGLIAGRSMDACTPRAKELLERLNIGGRAGHKPNQMSGGEQQRVAVARALFNSPSVFGILLTLVIDGREGIKALFSRAVRWRVRPVWYAAALLVPATMYGLNYVVQGLLGG